MAAVAEFYSGNLALEGKKGMVKEAKFGGTPGPSPVGYRNVRDRIDGKDIGVVVLDEPHATHIRWAFKTFATPAAAPHLGGAPRPSGCRSARRRFKRCTRFCRGDRI